MNYYLTRTHATRRWQCVIRPFANGERIGPYPDHATAKQAAKELNATIPPRPKKPGGGRIAKLNRRHNLAIRADLSKRLVNAAERDGVTVTAVVEGLIEKYL